MHKVCHIEFNEANFALIKLYLNGAPERKWPNLRKLMKWSNIETSSEGEYRLLEPWIQWASVHTGESATEHKIFRLGDISRYEKPLLFDDLEKQGVTVGCLSAMNVNNRLEHPAYFIPDPWTISASDGSFFSEKLSAVLHQTVNDNASGKLTYQSISTILLAMFFKTKIKNWPAYAGLFLRSLRKKRWCKALFLDLLISDIHLNLHNKKNPQFTTVFFNGFAHIQHHYFFNSQFYEGDVENPSWYISSDQDPFVDALNIYDRIFSDHISHFEGSEVIISTALRQVPHTHKKFYYRLSDHEAFLTKIGLTNFKVYPRMTRDFMIEFMSEDECTKAETVLQNIRINNKGLFNEVENRGCSLFVTLTYDKEINEVDVIPDCMGNDLYLKNEVVFVALKNGMHDHKGYSYSSKPSNSYGALHNKHVKVLCTYIKSRLKL
jgi:hypothetical protein